MTSKNYLRFLRRQQSEAFHRYIISLQWRNYVRRGEATASGRQAAGGATEFNKKLFVYM